MDLGPTILYQSLTIMTFFFNVGHKHFYVYAHIYTQQTTNYESIGMKVLQVTLRVNFFNKLILRR
jgi:hypothetical protein